MDKEMIKNSYSIKRYQMICILGTFSFFLFSMVGCTSIPAPTTQISASRTALNDALSAGGSELAPLPLKSAIEKMEAAERAMGKEDYGLARRFAEQAQVDAQLARAIARSAKAQKAAEALQESSRVLRQEIGRQAP